MPRHIDRILAISIALLVNGAVVWFLDRSAHQLAVSQDNDSAALQVVWVTAASHDRPGESAPARAPGRPRASPLPTPRELAVAPTPAIGRPQAVTDNRGLPTAPAALDLRLPDAQPSFRRDPLAHRAQFMEASPERMGLTFMDRSIGGVLQRMTKNNICGELRLSLLSVEGSADAILRTMRAYGCIR